VTQSLKHGLLTLGWTNLNQPRANRSGLIAIPLAAASLLWPALWNGYPIVFADTGTYISQAVHHYAGWDRPVFYSLFILALHWKLTLWPVIMAQALLTTWILWLSWHVVAPRAHPAWFLAGMALLSAASWLPWLVCEIMPDIFTPLLILALGLVGFANDRVSRTTRIVLAGLASLFIASQLSSVPLAAALIALCLLLQPSWQRLRHAAVWLCAPLALAIVALCSANVAAHGQFTVSPFGNIFLLARIIYDGPGLAVMRQDCATTAWRLCPYRDRLPPDADAFLWTKDSPLNRAGGPKIISAEAGAIISQAARQYPVAVIQAALRNTWDQLSRFDSGDGLTPWPDEVTGRIHQDLSTFDQQRYDAARQQQGTLTIPALWNQIHRTVALAGLAACLVAVVRTGRRGVRGLLLIVLLALPISAGVTGALSAPHDRYQSRIMWLPPFLAAAALAAWRRSAGARQPDVSEYIDLGDSPGTTARP
jgi:hypothetical protein